MNRGDTLTGIVVVTDMNGRVSYWSPAAEAAFGWAATEAVGRPLKEWLAPSPAATMLAELSRETGPHPVHGECAVRCKSAGARALLLETVPLTAETEAMYGLVHVFRELNGGKEAERQALDVANSRTVTVDRKQIHDLNNLLTSIHSSLDLALGEPLPASLAVVLSEAQLAARRAAGLANSFRQLQRPSEAAPGAADPQPAPSGPAALEGTERILVTEDDKNTRMLLRAILSYRGYHVVEAGNGEEALACQAGAETPFDLALLDVNLPGMSGVDVLRLLRRRQPGLRAVFLSGDVDHARDVHPPAAPGMGFLSKPFENIDLLRTVRQVLEEPAGTPASGVRSPGAGGL